MIRRAHIEDADAIVRVINESNYHAFKTIIPPEFFRYPVVDRNEILDDMKKMHFYVYEIEGSIVGVAALQPFPDQKLGVVRWVYVLPEYQRRGIGRALMMHIEDEARKIGLKKLRLVTHEKAWWAIEFYKKLGFKIVGYIDRAAWRDVVMEKEL